MTTAALYWLYFLAFVILNIFKISLRMYRMSIVANKYNLNFYPHIIENFIFFGKERKYNIISGNLDKINILIYDYYNYTTNDFTIGNFPEKVTMIKIGDVRKITGYRVISWAYSNNSQAFCSLNKIKTILSEVEQFGYSETYDNLQDGRASGIHLISIPFVQESPAKRY